VYCVLMTVVFVVRTVKVHPGLFFLVYHQTDRVTHTTN